MSSETGSLIAPPVERTKQLLYEAGGLRDCLEELLVQNGIWSELSANYTSLQTTPFRITVTGVLREKTIRGISVQKRFQAHNLEFAEPEYSALIPTEEGFEAACAYSVVAHSYFAKDARVLHCLPIRQQKESHEERQHGLYMAVLNDINQQATGFTDV